MANGILLNNIDIRLFAAATLFITPVSWNVRDNHDSYWRFYVNDREGAYLGLGEDLFPLHKGRAYFVPAGVQFHCITDESVEHFYVHFDVLGLSEGVRNALFSTPIEIPHHEWIQPEVSAIGNLVRGADPQVPPLEITINCRLKSLIYAHLSHYLASIPAEKMESALLLDEVYRPLLPALRFIDENLAKPLTIKLLARQCHLSEDYFIRRFRQSLGQSPIHYVQRKRIAWAAQQLLFTSATIDEIASASGFGNRFYFSRVFNKHLGASPAAYRSSGPQ